MPNTVLGDLSKLVINGNEMNIKDATLTETVEEIIYAIQQNNQDISDRINDLNDRSFDNIIKISSNNESEISAINDGLYKIQYVTVTGEGEQQTETLNNSAILIQQGTHQYLYKDGKLSNREKTNNTWGDWITFEGGVTSVNGQTGAVTLSIPTKTSDITNDSGFITDAGVTSFNGSTGAVTYTAPVTSVDGKTGAVTIEHPVTSVNGQTGTVTIDTGVTSFNGQTGIVTYTAPVTSVNGQTGAVTIDLTGKADKSAAIGSLQLSINSTDYKVTLSGTKVDGTVFTCEDVIDLPLETMVVSGAYDDTTQKIVLTLKNGTTTDFPVSALIDGLQSEITSTNKLSADLISDGNINKVVTQAEKDTWNNKVTSVNGQTGAVTIDTGVTSFNSQTGAITYTAPVTSVNGQTGAVTIDTGVTSFNGQTGAVTYTAPVTSVNGQTGAVVTELSSEYATSTAVNDELELAAGDTYEEAFGKIEKALNDHATITATALNTLAQNSQLNTIESISVNGVPVPIDSSKNVDITISNDNDEVIGEALIDLNDRLEVVEGISVGDENIIEAVKVNGTTLVPDANKAVNISVPVDLADLADDATHRLVTDIEKSTWNNNVTSVNGQTGAVTIDTGVTSFNGQTGTVTYTAPVTSVNEQTGDITVSEFTEVMFSELDDVTTPGVYKVLLEGGGINSTKTTYGILIVDISQKITPPPSQTTRQTIIDKYNHRTRSKTQATEWTDWEEITDDVYVVKFTTGYDSSAGHETNNVTCDRTYDEIQTAIESGKVVIGQVAYLYESTNNDDFTYFNVYLNDAEFLVGSDITFGGYKNENYYITIIMPYGSTGNDCYCEYTYTFDIYQSKLVSGENIKTVNNQSLLGSGNISVGVTSFNGATGAITYTPPVTSVNGQTGAVTIDTGVTSFNGQTGAVTYTAPVTSVNGQTGAVTIDTGVTSFNGSTGAVTYTAPVTSVNGQTGAVNLSIPDAVTESTVAGWGFTKNTGTYSKPSTGIPASDLADGVIPDVPVQSVNGQTGAVNINVGVTSFNGQTGAITYTAPVTSVNGATGAVTVKANVQSDWNATTGDAVILNKPTIPTVNDSTVTITMNGNTVGTFTLNKSGNTTIDLGNVLTSHQSIKTINNQTITGTGNISLNTLPTVSASDNGKVLMVVNGAWQLVSPVTLYSGSSAPNNSQGNNGDIYVQS